MAHTAHLEAVLAGTPEETIEVAEAPHLKSLMSYYTEQGVLARRDRDMAALADEIEQAVATRYAALQADPPSDPKAAPPKTPGDVPWDFQTLLSNRPLDVWMHEQDIRRATGRPGGYDCAAAAHVLRTFGRGAAHGRGQAGGAAAGHHRPAGDPGGRAWAGACASVTTAARPRSTTTWRRPRRSRCGPRTTSCSPAGAARPATTEPRITGDEELARRVLEALAVTP